MKKGTKRILIILAAVIFIYFVLAIADVIKLGAGGSEEVQVREISVGAK